jgi:hypothetical protein
VPLAQYVAEPVEGTETPEWKSTDRYVPEEDPLQKVPERRAGAKLFYYHGDQIVTPQLLTDEYGGCGVGGVEFPGKLINEK